MIDIKRSRDTGRRVVQPLLRCQKGQPRLRAPRGPQQPGATRTDVADAGRRALRVGLL